MPTQFKHVKQSSDGRVYDAIPSAYYTC